MDIIPDDGVVCRHAWVSGKREGKVDWNMHCANDIGNNEVEN